MESVIRVAATRIAMCVVLFIVCSAGGYAKPPPLSINELNATRSSTPLVYVRKLDDGPGFSAYLVSYKSAGLTLYAMVAVPESEAPSRGFPVLVANHGFHPNPSRYGITAAGIDSRPGDYYRSIPALYAKQGFLVVIPDYRGHNNSEGREFTSGFLATGYYTEDVLALLSGLRSIKNADLENVFMWGHSLGAEVSLRALLATDIIKGATLWSSVGGEIWDQAYYYSRYEDLTAVDSQAAPKRSFDKLRKDIGELGVPYDWTAREPLRYLAHLKTPIVIHHAIGDQGADYRWSMRLAKELYLIGHPYIFYSYSGADHFFQGTQIQEAVDRDVRYFRDLMSGTKPGATNSPISPRQPH